MSLCTRASGYTRGFCSRLYSAGQYAKAAVQTIPFAIHKIKEAGAECNARQKALDGSLIGLGTTCLFEQSHALRACVAAGMMLGEGSALRDRLSPQKTAAIGIASIATMLVGGLARRAQNSLHGRAVGLGEIFFPIATLAGTYALMKRTLSPESHRTQYSVAFRIAGGFLMPAVTPASAALVLLPPYLLNKMEAPAGQSRAREYANLFLTTGISAHAAAAGFAVAGPVGAVVASAASNVLLNTASKIVEKRDHYLAPIADAFRQNLSRLKSN